MLLFLLYFWSNKCSLIEQKRLSKTLKKFGDPNIVNGSVCIWIISTYDSDKDVNWKCHIQFDESSKIRSVSHMRGKNRYDSVDDYVCKILAGFQAS